MMVGASASGWGGMGREGQGSWWPLHDFSGKMSSQVLCPIINSIDDCLDLFFFLFISKKFSKLIINF